MRIIFAKDVPFNVTSSPTRIGDAIVVKDGSSYSFYLHKGTGITLVDVTTSIKLIDGHHGINIVFNKGDLQARTGDARVLQFLVGVFKNKDVKSFFQTAYNILKFNEERWDGDVLARLYTTIIEKEQNIVEKPFKLYLCDSLRDTLNNLLERGIKKSDALRQIKNENKDEFMRAFNEFKKDYPNKSILED